MGVALGAAIITNYSYGAMMEGAHNSSDGSNGIELHYEHSSTNGEISDDDDEDEEEEEQDEGDGGYILLPQSPSSEEEKEEDEAVPLPSSQININEPVMEECKSKVLYTTNIS